MAIATGAALAVGAGVVGGSALASGYFQNKAASQQKRALNNLYSQQQALANQASARLDPYAATGQQALSPLTGLVLGQQYNPETGGFDAITPEQRLALFESSPSYQFQLEEGQRALERSQSARAGLLGGRATKEALRYSQGLASQDYYNQLGVLGNLAGSGQQAATSQAGQQLSAMPTLANIGQQAATTNFNQGAYIANTIGNMGSALAGYGLSNSGGNY